MPTPKLSRRNLLAATMVSPAVVALLQQEALAQAAAGIWPRPASSASCRGRR